MIKLTLKFEIAQFLTGKNQKTYKISKNSMNIVFGVLGIKLGFRGRGYDSCMDFKLTARKGEIIYERQKASPQEGLISAQGISFGRV